MTYPPNVRTAPPPVAPSPLPPRPSVPPPGPAGAGGLRELGRDGADRLRRAARTEPGRLRLLGAALALLVIVFGAVTAWQSSDRYASADDVVSRGQTVKDTADLYGALADADTQAATGFLAGATEPADVQAAYRGDVSRAGTLLSGVAENTAPGSRSADLIASISRQLPVYTGLIERARAENRRGLPLGGAYLRYANDRMTRPGGILPAAEALYTEESSQLGAESGAARTWPYAALALGVIALYALARVQRRNYRHTNRVFNRGLLTATAACTAALLWLVAGQALGNIGLHNADRHGQRSLTALNAARINALKARADENLSLVSRGSVVAADGKTDKYEVDFGAKTKALSGDLGRAESLADDGPGRTPVAAAVDAVATWQTRHRLGSRAGADGRFQDARAALDGSGTTSEQAFNEVNKSIATAIQHEQDEFTTSAKHGRGALTLVWLGAAVLAVLGAVSAILGVGRRLSEYR
ncbi:hypothetical protein [Streptomyces sp. NBC_01497]|uniref:hypothetical protein n=1 Tax=Streptomyces sp. NBC_01497 TaxID=2903885 RepID=UPI002E2F9798|nr:hypothetical protein [Streptomyces sp. NBC_01497]